MSDRTQSTHAQRAELMTRASSTSERLLNQVIERTLETGFDVDAFHVMDQRDTRLIQDEVMGGPRSSKFVYDFEIQGTPIRGVSAVGARELATYYKGIKHRLISSTRKIGPLFVFTTYPSPGVPPAMETRLLPELKDEPDGYEAVCEVQDIKTGNSMMAAKFEAQWEWSNQKKTYFEKPHFATIAQSKAQRNGILMVIPQAIQLEWMTEIVKLGKKETITTGVLAEKRDGVVRFCAARGVPIDRAVLDALLLEQIMGLSEAARTQDKDAFMAAAIALGLTSASGATQEVADEPSKRRRPANAAAGAKAPGQPPQEQRQAPNPSDAAGARQQTVDTRSGADDPGKQQTTTQTQSKPQTTQQPAQTVQQQPSASAFEAWASDENGEPVEVGDEPLVIHDPVEFATWFVNRHMTSDNADALRENNMDAIAEAMNWPEAAEILTNAVTRPQETHQGGQDAGGTDQDAMFVPVPLTAGGKPHWPNYAEDCRRSLEKVQNEAQLITWLTLNEPTYRGKAIMVKLDLHVAATRQRLQPQQETQQQEQRQPEATKVADRDADAVAVRLREIADCQTANSVLAMQTGMIMKTLIDRLDRERPDLAQQLRSAFEARIAQINAGAGR